MADLIKFGSTSNIVRFTLKDKATGQGKAGLSLSTSGLIISTICNNEASPTTYTQAGSTIETISTLGTFAAPTATKCRLKEVSAVNNPGLYEFQFADARFAVSSSKQLIISVNDGESTIMDTDYQIQLVQFDPYDAIHLGLTAIPNTACTTNASLITSGTGTDQLSITSGRIDLGKILGTTSVGAVGYVGIDWGQVTNKTTTNALTGTTIATTQQVDVNTIKTQTVTCSASVTVNSNVGTTQPVNFTGTSGSALIKTDVTDWATHSVSVDTNNIPEVNGLTLLKESSNTYDMRQVITMIFEMAAYGKISGLPSSPAVLRDFADTLNRATIAFDSNNNRTSVTINNAP